jgi:hypothetical protein
VAAASYEACTYGVFSAMPMAEVLRRCPYAIVAAMERYAERARGFAILDDLARGGPAVRRGLVDPPAARLFAAARGGRGDQGACAEQRWSRRWASPTKIGEDRSTSTSPMSRSRPTDRVRRAVGRLYGVGEVGQMLRERARTIGDVAGYPERRWWRGWAPTPGR